MAVHTVNIDVVDPTSNNPIAVICVPQPCENYAATAYEVKQLIQIVKYYVYEAGTNKIISGKNYYDYFPEEKPGGGGGTSDYNELKNQPSINNITLIGNKSLSNLGIAAEGDIPTSGADIGLGNVDNTSDLNKPISTATQAALDTKVDKVTGKGLSTNDYTTTEKDKLDGIEAQANKTIVDNALSDSSTNPVQNKIVKNALGNKQDTLTETQLTAVNSGITSTDVTQIGTNKNDISTINQTIGDINTVLEGVL